MISQTMNNMLGSSTTADPLDTICNNVSKIENTVGMEHKDDGQSQKYAATECVSKLRALFDTFGWDVSGLEAVLERFKRPEAVKDFADEQLALVTRLFLSPNSEKKYGIIHNFKLPKLEITTHSIKGSCDGLSKTFVPNSEVNSNDIDDDDDDDAHERIPVGSIAEDSETPSRLDHVTGGNHHGAAVDECDSVQPVRVPNSDVLGDVDELTFNSLCRAAEAAKAHRHALEAARRATQFGRFSQNQRFSRRDARIENLRRESKTFSDVETPPASIAVRTPAPEGRIQSDIISQLEADMKELKAEHRGLLDEIFLLKRRQHAIDEQDPETRLVKLEAKSSANDPAVPGTTHGRSLL